MSTIIKSLCIALCAMSCSLMAHGRTITDVLELNNGSILEGYISLESNTQGITFTSFKATIILPEKLIKDEWPIELPFKSLEEEWKNWAEQNDPEAKNKETFVLNNLDLRQIIEKQDTLFSQVRDLYRVKIIERGTNYLIVDLKEKNYRFAWKDIKTLKKADVDPSIVNGTTVSVKLDGSNRIIKGTLIEQVPGQSLKIMAEDGVKESLKQEKVKSVLVVKKNPEQSILQQSQLEETIVTKSGEEYRGVIVQRTYENEGKGFIAVMTKDSDIPVVVSRSDLKEIRRIENLDYKPVKEMNIDLESMLVNGVDSLKTISVENIYWMYYITEDSLDFQKLPVLKDVQNDLVIQAAESVDDLSDWRLVKVEKSERPDKSMLKSFNSVFKNNATNQPNINDKNWLIMSDAVDGVYTPIVKKDTLAKVQTASFGVVGKGLYMIYQKNKSKAVLIEIDE